MSYKVGQIEKRYTRITEIASITIFLSLTLVFTLSKSFDNSDFIAEVKVPDFFEIDVIDITTQPEKVVKPNRFKIPIAAEDDEKFEEDEEFEIEDNIFDFDEPAPPPPTRLFAEDDDDELIPYHIIQEKPELSSAQGLIFSKYIANNYPKMARRAGINGKVTLKFICSKKGVPTKIRVISEKPKGMEFGKVAIEALKAVRFSPGIQRDTPVNVSMAWPVKFGIK